jgi:hypothetical protein
MKKLLLLTILICLIPTTALCSTLDFCIMYKKEHPLIEKLLVIDKSNNETVEETEKRVTKAYRIASIFNERWGQSTTEYIMSEIEDIEGPVYTHGWTVHKRNDQTYLIGFWLAKDSSQELYAVRNSCLLYKNPTNENHYCIGWLYEVNIITETRRNLKDDEELQNVWGLSKDLMMVEVIRPHNLKVSQDIIAQREKEERQWEYNKKNNDKGMGTGWSILVILGIICCALPFWGWILVAFGIWIMLKIFQ